MLSRFLDFDDHLEVALRTHVVGRLDATPGHVDNCTRDYVGFEIVAVWAERVGLRLNGNSIAGYLNEEMVELVAVHRAPLAGLETDLPHANLIVLEHELGAHITDHAVLAHVTHSR